MKIEYLLNRISQATFFQNQGSDHLSYQYNPKPKSGRCKKVSLPKWHLTTKPVWHLTIQPVAPITPSSVPDQSTWLTNDLTS